MLFLYNMLFSCSGCYCKTNMLFLCNILFLHKILFSCRGCYHKKKNTNM